MNMGASFNSHDLGIGSVVGGGGGVAGSPVVSRYYKSNGYAGFHTPVAPPAATAAAATASVSGVAAAAAAIAAFASADVSGASAGGDTGAAAYSIASANDSLATETEAEDDPYSTVNRLAGGGRRGGGAKAEADSSIYCSSSNSSKVNSTAFSGTSTSDWMFSTAPSAFRTPGRGFS
jgi:hypothetical protein